VALSKEEFRNRAKAGAALNGLGLRELRDALEEFGADRTLYQTMYADEKARGLPRNIRDLAETLHLPRAWFTEPTWTTLVPGSGDAARAPVDPEALELEQDLEDAGQQSESTEPNTGEQAPGVPKKREG
jgi:hypothetical protein